MILKILAGLWSLLCSYRTLGKSFYYFRFRFLLLQNEELKLDEGMGVKCRLKELFITILSENISKYVQYEIMYLMKRHL